MGIFNYHFSRKGLFKYFTGTNDFFPPARILIAAIYSIVVDYLKYNNYKAHILPLSCPYHMIIISIL